MPAKDDRFAKWEGIRKQGFIRFVLVHGVIGWGIVTGILFACLMWLFADADFGRLLPLAMPLFALGGVLWGAGMWWFVERKYRQHVAAGEA